MKCTRCDGYGKIVCSECERHTEHIGEEGEEKRDYCPKCGESSAVAVWGDFRNLPCPRCDGSGQEGGGEDEE